MPKLLLERRYWIRVKKHQQERASWIRAQWKLGAQPNFIDYWPNIPGTIPEKMVFAELVRRQINFYFSIYFGDMFVTPTIVEHYRPDFYLPDYKIIIEVYGIYWHTRMGQWEHDAVKQFVYSASGYKVYILTDTAVLDNVQKAVGDIPEIASASIHGTNWIIGKRPFNPTAALAARLRQWPKVRSVRYARRRGAKKILISAAWKGESYPAKSVPPMGGLVTSLSAEVRAAAEKIVDILEKPKKRKKKR